MPFSPDVPDIPAEGKFVVSCRDEDTAVGCLAGWTLA